MHHKPADAARCRMQSTQSDLGFALLSMLGPLILPVTAASVAVDAASSYRIEYQPPLITHGSLPPEPPPPRS